jgi:hypothetical protein
MDFLQLHVPIEIWRWLKKQPSLPRVYCGMQWSGHVNSVAHVIRVRRLEEINLLKSLLLIWSNRHSILPKNLHEMESWIREDFGRVRMEHHQKDLLEWLDHVLRRLDWKQESSVVRDAKIHSSKLREVLTHQEKRSCTITAQKCL